MSILEALRNSRLLRKPLLAASRTLLTPLHSGPGLLRRAFYDAMPVPHVVTGTRESFIVSTSDKAIGRELFLHGEFDFWKLETALSILDREGRDRPTHLIDVGANIGTIVIPTIARGLMQTATAVEPHPDNLKLLKANLALNDVASRVDVLAVAVGESDSLTLRLHESKTNSGNHSIGDEGIPVPCIRLDTLNIPARASLLWMDIEGYEGHALAGATSILRAGTPVVSEFNPSYLANSGGLERFLNHLKSRKIFDLGSSSAGETTLEDLIRIHSNTFTDILAL